MDFITFIDVFFIAVGLAMDAFSVAVSTGICMPYCGGGHYLRLSLSFGFFQFAMPLIGFFAGRSVEPYIREYDHWVAFVILAAIGGKMIHEALAAHECKKEFVDNTRGKRLLLLSVATSIDALAVGVGFGVMGRPVVTPAIIIGVVCAAFTAAGIYIGCKAGELIGKRAEIIGGVVLIIIGLKILLEHTVFK